MRIGAIVSVVALAFLCVLPAEAHDLSTAYLEVTAQDDTTYDVTWRTSKKRSLDPIFPAFCQMVGKRKGRQTSRDEMTYDWVIKAEKSLIGERITIKGLENSILNTLVRIELPDGGAVRFRLTPAKPSGIVPAKPSVFSVIQTYTGLGIEHILGGIDHLLFVLALLLIIEGVGKLLKAITSFTVAHSITLAMASLGFVNLPSPPVEAIIALSIVFVASEILHHAHREPGLAERSPWMVAAAFGLLHGFGFAGALKELGLPEGDIPVALFTFNVGVELGQLAFVSVVLAIGWGVARFFRWPAWSKPAAAYGIGAMAAYWVIDRMTGFF
jgi:hydrogenase/urease accessory protein HupE